jgi:DNA-dependent RNA polymerase auxiliary subunit epsilon
MIFYQQAFKEIENTKNIYLKGKIIQISEQHLNLSKFNFIFISKVLNVYFELIVL